MFKKAFSFALLLSASLSVNAGVVTAFDSGWTDFTTQPNSTDNSGNSIPTPEDQTGSFDYVYPGWGGQAFDAEYLFYRIDGNRLSIGLQTGFDIINGQQTTGNHEYYAGDLALSFDGVTPGDSSTYEYAVDFGFNTKDYYGGDTGTHAAGLYQVDNWNNNIYFDGAGGNGSSNSNSKDSSAPFAMSSGIRQNAANFTTSFGEEIVNGQKSYFRIASFDIDYLDISQIDAHWTMSCGNDAVDGTVAAVPEPSVLWLFSIGFVGLLANGIRRRQSRQA